MTREEAHAKVTNWIDSDEDIKYTGTWHYGKRHLHRDIDKIYDSIESRTCENCKWYGDTADEWNSKECPLEHITDGKTFGCNKWQQKD